MEGPDRGLPSLFTATPLQVLVGVALFIALLNGQRDLAVLSLLVLGVIGGSRLWAQLSLAGLQCRLVLDKRRVFPGELIHLTVAAENAKFLPVSIEVQVPTGDVSQGEQALAKATSLLWFQRTQFEWKFTLERRGVYSIGPLGIRAGDLFSFFSRNRQTNEVYSLMVYPRLVPLKIFSLPRRDFFGAPRAKSPVQDPVYILGTRDYEHSQPSRYIHWKASARHHRLQEKVFEPTAHEKVLLAVDVDSFAKYEAADDLERGLEVVASIAVRLEREGHAVGLVTDGALRGDGRSFVPVARNYEQLPAILEMLARIEMNSAREIRYLIRQCLSDAWGASCIYFAHHADETLLAAQDFFNRRQIPVIFFVCESNSHPGANELGRSKVYHLDDIRTPWVPSP